VEVQCATEARMAKNGALLCLHSSGSHQVNTPLIPSCQCTNGSGRERSESCRDSQIELPAYWIGVATVISDLVTPAGVLQRKWRIAVEQINHASGELEVLVQVVRRLKVERRVGGHVQAAEGDRIAQRPVGFREENAGAFCIRLIRVPGPVVGRQTV